MKRKTFILLGAMALTACGHKPEADAKGSNGPDPVGDAYKICQAFTNTGMTTECNVGGFASTIDVRMDMNSEEARKTCVGAVELVGKQTPSLTGRWKLRIFSPYSGDHPIAVCSF